MKKATPIIVNIVIETIKESFKVNKETRPNFLKMIELDKNLSTKTEIPGLRR